MPCLPSSGAEERLQVVGRSRRCHQGGGLRCSLACGWNRGTRVEVHRSELVGSYWADLMGEAAGRDAVRVEARPRLGARRGGEEVELVDHRHQGLGRQDHQGGGVCRGHPEGWDACRYLARLIGHCCMGRAYPAPSISLLCTVI